MKPELIEQRELLQVKLVLFIETKDSMEETEDQAKNGEKSREKIVVVMRENPTITQNKLAEILQVSVKAVEKQLRSLREDGVIRRIGSDKGGHWEVIEKENEYSKSGGV